jgi:hypothetical protein
VLNGPPPSVAHAVRSAAVSDPVELGVYRQVHAFVRRANCPPIALHAAFPAVPNGALPWAPSLTQSPWLANVPSVSGTSVFHPPFWQIFAVSLLPPLAATAGPAATPLTATAKSPDDRQAPAPMHRPNPPWRDSRR